MIDEKHELIPTSSKATQRIGAVLRIPKFLAFSISQAVSLFGDKLDYMALLAMIAGLATVHGWESSRAISMLSVVITLPIILFGPLAGVLVDRWNRRTVMIVCDSSRAILVFATPLVALKTQSLAIVFTIAFFVFLLGQFFNVARLSVIPNLVESRNILEANSFTSLLGRASTFLGMLLGGLIVDWQIWQHLGIRESWTGGFFIDGLTFVVSAVTLMFLKIKFAPRPMPSLALADPPPNGNGRKSGSIFTVVRDQVVKAVGEFREAFQMIRQMPPVRFVILSIVLMVMLGAAILVLLVPVIQSARDDLGLGSGTKGVGFVGAAGSVGLVISSLVYGFIGRRIKRRTVILGGFALLGIIGGFVAISNSLALTLFLAMIAGLILSPIYIVQDTVIHETVPEQARGRIFSTREWFMSASFALAALIIGQVTRIFPQDFAQRFNILIIADYRRLLFLAVCLLVTLLSVVGLFVTRKQTNI